jgi:hypothetical protein
MKDLKYVCVAEEWRDIPDFEGYQVSSFGKVRNKKLKQLKEIPNRQGYLEVRFSKQGKSTPRVIHRLVAKTFLENSNNYSQVNHIDGNKRNNRTENLEWVNNSMNQKHAYSLGLQPSRAGERNVKSAIKNKDVAVLKELYNSGKTIRETSNVTGIGLSIVRNIIYGKTWKDNTLDVVKRDDRLVKSAESVEKAIITKQSKGMFGVSIVQLSKDNKELNTFRSINDASIKTGIPRKSIEAVVHEKEFYSKDRSRSWKMTEAGGFVWRKI